MLTLSGSILMFVLATGTAAIPAPAPSPYRFDDDPADNIGSSSRQGLYTDLKFLPVADDPITYVSFGADLRERVESSNVEFLGLRDRRRDTYDLHRLLVYADLHIERLRVFVQLGDELQTGREPSALPTDVDRGDLAQGFVDYRLPLAERSLTLRGGRFEMSFDEGALISLRDGPNVRQVWQGAQGIYQTAIARTDVFAVKPVDVEPGWFDDDLVRGQSLWGVHIDVRPSALAPLEINGFYYGNDNPRVLFYPLPGREHTNTFGVRGSTDRGGLDASIGAMLQTGSFDTHPVRAWSGHVDAGWTLQSTGWRPRLAWRADVLSGGNDTRGIVRTFNPLYPNYSFSTEATIEAPANLIQTGLMLQLRPRASVDLQYKVEGLWRYSEQDAFYGVPTLAAVQPIGPSGGRYSGSEQQWRAAWQINRYLNLTVAFVHFDPASFLRAARAVTENFGMAEFALRL